MGNLTVAIIHFIGLAMFSTHVPGNEGALRVLLPRIEQHANHPTSEGPISKPIESHAAAILFKRADVQQEIGWESEAVPTGMLAESGETGLWRMVRLNGEHLTFMATGPNDPVDTKKLELPKLTCALRLARTSDPAATVAIPAGTLSTCKANGRFDTQLALNNTSLLTIWAESSDVPKKATKALILNPGATVYVVNIPTSLLLQTESGEETDPRHFLGYYTLLRMEEAACEPTFNISGLEADVCPNLPLVLPPDPLVNSDCSNTAWP